VFPLGFAHRGGCALAPENTLAAFRLALELGATGLESDVWTTRDGVPILDHDGEFEGRSVAQWTRSELPPHVPSLSELYEACGTDVPLSLDVKAADAAPSVIDVARRHGALGSLWLCHWNWKTVASWRALSEAIHLVDATRTEHMRTAPEPRARRMAALGIEAINLPQHDWSEAWIETFQRYGRRTFAWDLQRDVEFDRLLTMGIDAVYSDHVDRMMRALGRRDGRAASGTDAARRAGPQR